MYQSNGMYSNYEVESSKESFKESKTTVDTNKESFKGITTEPIYECPEERVIHREIFHEVPHVCPVNTRIINHHIYRHTYRPCYTCQEENEICNINCGCSCKF